MGGLRFFHYVKGKKDGGTKMLYISRQIILYAESQKTFVQANQGIKKYL